MNIATARLLAESDFASFDALLATHGLGIVGKHRPKHLDKAVQVEMIESLASGITSDVDESISLTESQAALRHLATEYGYIVKLLAEQAPPGWEAEIERLKKTMPTQQAYAKAWTMHKQGLRPGQKKANKIEENDEIPIGQRMAVEIQRQKDEERTTDETGRQRQQQNEGKRRSIEAIWKVLEKLTPEQTREAYYTLIQQFGPAGVTRPQPSGSGVPNPQPT